MKLLSQAKINFGLSILNKRTDGFHNIESIIIPIALHDELSVEESDECTFTTSGIPITPDPNANLCMKAYRLLKNDFDIPAINIHLHKNIPVGSGLGGGSSNAVATLKALDRLFDLKMRKGQFLDYAAQLGSDCPFFVENKIALAQGKGEILEEISLNLEGLDILLVYPNISVSTAEAFQIIKASGNAFSLKNINSLPKEKWQGYVRNSFSEVIFKECPEVAKIQEKLLKKGAIYSSMSGSGSAVYAFFPKGEIPEMEWPSDYIVWRGDLK